MPSTRTLVVLVGRRLPHNENLGLAYLRAALVQAGAEVRTFYVNDGSELARAVQAILAEPPALLGLSLADGGSALLPLALGEAVTRAGYRGHITAGGQFATLSRAFLLERYPWLGSVVRFAGEVPLVALLRRIEAGEPVEGVPGVTTRGGDGAPAPVMGQEPLAIRPMRDELPEILGHRAAHLTASRGCQGRCAYCGPAALQTQERREGERGGQTRLALTAAGVGGVRRREIEAVCEEMAYLFHERGVRYFYFVDEHLLPYEEPEARSFLDAWREGLRARKVGKIGIGTMLRADRCTEPMIRSFADLGLVRAFVGLEIACDEEARRFGRRAPGPREIGLLRTFAEAGVTTVSNLMLVHPYSTEHTIRAGLDLLERIPNGVFEATRMMVYHGTRLFDAMVEEGRIVGNPLRYGYTFPDPAMERFSQIFSRIRGEAFWNYSVAYRTHDAHLAVSLADRLCPERVPAELAGALDEVRRKVNRLYVTAYRRALDLAMSGGAFRESSSLVGELRAASLDLERRLTVLEARLLTVAPQRAGMFAPMRSAAAAAVSFVLASAAAACGGKVIVDNPQADGGTEADGGGGKGGAGPCADAGADPTPEQIQAALAKGASCYSGPVSLEPGLLPQLGFSLNAYSGALGVSACMTAKAQAAVSAENAKAAAALAAACIGDVSQPVSTYVQGGATTDGQKMADAITAACAALINGSFNQFTIVLDAGGQVVDVTGGPGTDALTACVKSALAGLSFPCLAGFEVCPEYVIAE
ncbi:MAG: radical SAM protein [Byssovorax sp.]